MRFAKTLSGRTVYTIIQGRLHEENPTNLAFTLSAVDTYILTLLLTKEVDEIKAAAIKEAGSEKILYAVLGNMEANIQLLPDDVVPATKEIQDHASLP